MEGLDEVVPEREDEGRIVECFLRGVEGSPRGMRERMLLAKELPR